MGHEHLYEYKTSDHAIQKRVGLDLELPFTVRPLLPLTLCHRSDRRPFGGRRRTEGCEVMCTDEEAGNFEERLRIYLRPHSPCESLAKRISDRFAEELVPISPRGRIKTWVKVCGGYTQAPYRNISREFCVERFEQSCVRMRPLQIKCGHLSLRMNSRVRPASHDHGRSL